MDLDLVSDALVSLREIPGVQGAFVVDAFGRVLGSSASALFPSYALESAAQKVALLSEGIYENFDGSEDVFVGFEGFFVTLRRGAFGTLVVLAERTSNAEGVRMGTSVVARRLTMLHAQPAAVAPAPVARTMREAGAPPSDGARRTGSHNGVATGAHRASTQRNAPVSATNKVGSKTGGQVAPPSSTANPKSAPGKPPAKKKSDIWG